MNFYPPPATVSAFSTVVVQFGYNRKPLLTITRANPPLKFVSWVRDIDNDVISIPIVEEGDDPTLDTEIVKEVLDSIESDDS